MSATPTPAPRIVRPSGHDANRASQGATSQPWTQVDCVDQHAGPADPAVLGEPLPDLRNVRGLSGSKDDRPDGRVARLATGGLRTKGRRLEPVRNLPERLFAVKGGRVTTLAAGLEAGRLLLKDGLLYVGEYATGQIACSP